ncbi:MAG: hypothetical protein KF730_14625 [Sphingomonas sp.]|uniref:hypothetical protein n=1 Tax=Sphingomonas sp. TaxID=28214 RepID=UPI0025F16CD1|nr:hypothetical protein [Sphingomonas sp.]MBX3565802.1 hypothetical protein [Sphingomonas sp.]
MLFSLLLALQDVPATAVEAEQAMERAAQTEGQWTAVRRFAAPDAVVLSPQAVPVAEAYGEPDPPRAYHWWISDSYVSCDGRVAINTGPWEREGEYGWFTTVWKRQPDGSWAWIVDLGGSTETLLVAPMQPVTHKASCEGKAPSLAFAGRGGLGGSADNSLLWQWTVTAEGRGSFHALLWTGTTFETVAKSGLRQ